MKTKDLSVVYLASITEATTLPPHDDLHEVYLHPLDGAGEIEIGGGLGGRPLRLSLGRSGPFADPTPGWLLDSTRTITLHPIERMSVVVAMAKVSSSGPAEPVRVSPLMHVIGEGCTERTVWEILGAGGPSQRLRLGETYNPKGGWSSWPPHSFDHQPELAPEFEEVFLPFLRPKVGSALLRRFGRFCDGRTIDDAVSLRDGEMVNVPLGYHPIVAGPETELRYAWFYVSPIDKLYKRLPDGKTEYA